MFTQEELDRMSADQVHAAFQAYCAGANVDDVRAAAFPELKKKAEEKPTMTQQQREDIAMEIARRLAQSDARARDAMSYYLRRR